MRIVLALVSLLAFSHAPAASEALWALLKDGGQVVLIRHTLTTAGVGDPAGMRLDDCSTQRNLSDEGRAHAKRIGAAFRARGIPVARVESSPWCRCVETARLAFGGAPHTNDALGNLFGRPENRERQVKALQARLAQPRAAGNLVLVSHGSTIYALTGVSPGTGEMVVLTAQGAQRLAVD